MGASIKATERSVTIYGCNGLAGIGMKAPDLRAGAAFVIAALATFGAEIGLTYLLKALGREAKQQALVDSFRTMKPLTFAVFIAASEWAMRLSW